MIKYRHHLLALVVLLACWPAAAELRNPETFLMAADRPVITLDPAIADDAASLFCIDAVYERLIRRQDRQSEQFEPVLAAEVPTVENGGISADYLTYTFTLRPNVKFHAGGDLTAEDVEYSLERAMLVDADGGPSWMLLEALTSESSTRDDNGALKDGIIETILKAIETDGDTVIFHLPRPYPPLLAILATSAASILDTEWALEQGCWDGGSETVAAMNNPPMGQEPLREIMNGTGSYRMASWVPAQQFELERFEEYWGEKPALQQAVVRYVEDWDTRKTLLADGGIDSIAIAAGDEDLKADRMRELQAIEGLKRIDIPQPALTAMMFCQDITPRDNPNIGSGQLDGAGIPPDFFADIHVRTAFLHAFDRDTYAEDVLRIMEKLPTNPNVPGLPYALDVPVYQFDLNRSAEHLKTAFSGQVWEKGFTMTIPYVSGNEPQKQAVSMLAENITALNPKFTIQVVPMAWATYAQGYRQALFPLFISGWNARYADPHDVLPVFLKSDGQYAEYMRYANEVVDQLCEDGMATAVPKERKPLYEKLQQHWYADAVGLVLYQYRGARYYRDWVQGIEPDAAGRLSHLFKEDPSIDIPDSQDAAQ